MTKIAAIQLCSGANAEQNLARVVALVEQASHEGAKLVVLPEMFPIMGTHESAKLAQKEQANNGPIQAFLADLAKNCNVWLVAGTIPLESEHQDKVVSACLVYDNNGVQKARYDKIHLFDVTLSGNEAYRESDTILPGDKVVVVDTPFAKLGLAVCYDIRFPELFIRLAERGAELIAVPAAFTQVTGRAHWEVLMRARALDTQSYLIGAIV